MRSYADACGLARALDVVGERWALLVVRELMLGPKRYTDLAAALPGVSTNILGTRLAELEQAGVLTKRKLPPPLAVTLLELTPWGRELEPAIVVLGRWGAQTEVDLAAQTFSASSFVLSLRTTFSPSDADGVSARFAVRMGDERFVAQIADGALTVDRSDDVVGLELVGAPPALASVFHTGESLAAAVERGAVAVTGSPAGIDRVVACFALPSPASAVPLHPVGVTSG